MSLQGYDSFTRSNQNAWGTATNGVSWNVARGSNSSYHIATNEGTISGTTSETANFVGSGNKTSANFRVQVRMARATSTASSTAILARASVDGSHNLSGYKLRLKSGNLDLCSEITGTTAVIATVPYAVTPGSFDNTDLLIIGNQLWANAWPDGTDEPNGWMIGPITDNSITGSGQCGLGATLQPGDTASFDTFSWDNLVTVVLLPDSPYGYTLLNKTPIPTDTLQDIINENFTWVRAQTNVYPFIQPTQTSPETYNFALWDDIVQKCNNSGLRCCLTFQNPALWDCYTVTSPANPTDPIQIPLVANTIAFMTIAVTRYNGRTINPLTGAPYGTVQCWMLNEDADPYDAGWPGNGNPNYIGRDSTPFAAIFQQLYPIVKAQLPTCLVGCASLLGKRTDTTHITTWVNNLFGTWGSGKCYVDFLDLHFYNCYGAPTSPNPNLGDPDLADRINAMRQACVTFGFPNMDFWMTEVGYQQGSSPPETCDVTQAQQSAYLIQVYQIAFSLGVTHIFVWTIGSKDNNSLVQGHGNNKVYVPAYYGLQSFALANPGPIPTLQIHSTQGTIVGTAGVASAHGTSGNAIEHGTAGNATERGTAGVGVLTGTSGVATTKGR